MEKIQYIDWNAVSEIIDVDFIFSNPQFPWIFTSFNKTIRDHHILSHPEIEWDWEDLARNPNISPELIRRQGREFFFLSPRISMSEIEKDDLSYQDLIYISTNTFENSIDKAVFAQKAMYFLWIPRCYDPKKESGKRMAQHSLRTYMELIE